MSPQTEIPSAIHPPAGTELVLQAHASGVQIYVCQDGVDGKPGWTLKAPEATLYDDQDHEIGRHYAGPTWKHNDGSEITAKVAARVNAPDATAIPWLLLRVIGHSGSGIFSRITAIQRVQTVGGQAPSVGCDAAARGTEARSEYEAEYYFYANT